jgi:hypothetical protein
MGYITVSNSSLLSQNMRHLLLKVPASSRNPIKRFAMPSISFVIGYKKSSRIGGNKDKKMNMDKGKASKELEKQEEKTNII